MSRADEELWKMEWLRGHKILEMEAHNYEQLSYSTLIELSYQKIL